MYATYCKLSLIRYKPWVGNYPYQEVSEDNIIEEWKQFISNLDQPPDHLIQEYRQLTVNAARIQYQHTT